jgi:hypothetical protein
MKPTDWINLEQAASRLSGTTEEIACMVREGILGSSHDREGELLVHAGEIDRLVEVFPPANAALRVPQSTSPGGGRKKGAVSRSPT